MSLDYEAIHWGDPPDGEVDAKVYLGSAVPVGEIQKLGYATKKEGKWGVWEHEFEPHEGRGPKLLRGTRGVGSERISNPPPGDLIEIGRLVDVTLADGRRVVFGDAAVATTADGQHLVIVSERGTPYQIESRPGAHHVTERGIEE